MKSQNWKIAAAISLCLLIAAPAGAATEQQKCNKIKSKAAGKLFTAIQKCRQIKFVDPAFDEATCIFAGMDKLIAVFAKADTKFTCVVEGNGLTIAQDIEQAGNLIFFDL